MKRILLILAVLLLLPLTVRADDVTIFGPDSTQDTKLVQNAATTNYATATTLEAGFYGSNCMNAYASSWIQVNLDGTGYDTCAKMLIIITISADFTNGAADTIDVFWCTQSSVVVGEATYNVYSTGNNWTTAGGDFDTSHTSGFWQDDGAYVIGDLGSSDVCTLTVAHAGVDSLMQGTKVDNGLFIVSRGLWRENLACPGDAASSADLFFRSAQQANPVEQPHYVLIDVGIASSGPTGQVIIIGSRNDEDFDRTGHLSARSRLR